jgi:hypothetical protein
MDCFGASADPSKILGLGFHTGGLKTPVPKKSYNFRFAKFL